MTQQAGAGRRRVPLAVRAVVAVVLVWLGGTFAVGAYLAMRWELHPLSGEPGRPLFAAMYALLGLVMLGAPAIAWWFLLPRARWLGAVLVAAWALTFFTVFMGFF